MKAVDRTYLNLKSMVVAYDFLPNQPIVIEEASNLLNVSVTPVREALNRLLNEGLIIQVGGRGFQNRPIDREELTDLFLLRGALAVSTLHFVLNTDMRKRLDQILDERPSLSPVSSDLKMPICRQLLLAVGNREIIRIYANVSDKIHFVWNLYARSPRGAAQIEDYTTQLERLLRARNLPGSLDVIDSNVKLQVAALDELIPEALGSLFYRRSNLADQFSAALLGRSSPANTIQAS